MVDYVAIYDIKLIAKVIAQLPISYENYESNSRVLIASFVYIHGKLKFKISI